MLAARLSGNSSYDNPRPGRSGVASFHYFPHPPRRPIALPTSRAARPGAQQLPRGVWAVAPALSTPHCLRGTRQDLPCTSEENPAPRKPICKRDVVGAAETQEMRTAVDDDLLDARRGQMT